jgi:hypothetical protein
MAIRIAGWPARSRRSSSCAMRSWYGWKMLRARCGLCGRHRLIAGHDRVFALRDDRCRRVERPIAIDRQARVRLRDQKRVEQCCEPARDAEHTDVPRDVALELRIGQAERAERAR